MRAVLGAFVLMALVAPQPVLAQPAIDHGRLVVLLPQRVPHSAILPDAERKLVAMLNHARRARGLSPLMVNTSLRAAARDHSQDMALQGYVGHGSLAGLSLRERLAVFLRPGSHISENVAMVQSIEQGHVAFVASPAHRQNMLDPAFRWVGIGVATAGDLGIMITEDFT